MKICEVKMKDYFELRGVDASDYPPSMPGYIRPYLPPKNNKVIDIGCGYGQVLRYLKNQGFENLLGIDINSNALESLHKCGIPYYNNSNDLLFENRPAIMDGAHLIIMQHVLEHLPKGAIIKTLENIRRSLCDDGFLLVSVPNAQSHTGCYWAYEDFTHNCLFTAGSLLFVLKAAGFGDVQIIDADCTYGISKCKKTLKLILLYFYKRQLRFWNKVTSSSFHRPSPQVFSYEVKAIAAKNELSKLRPEY